VSRRRLGLALLLCLALGAPSARAYELEDIDAALAAAAAGEDLAERVPPGVALEAAARIDYQVAPDDLDRLAAVAQAGGAVPALARSLARVVAESRGDDGAAATARGLVWLGRLAPEALDPAVVELGGEALWVERLLDLADGADEAIVCAALELVARDGAPEVLQEYLARVSAAGPPRPRDLHLVQSLALTRRPLEVYTALVRLELAPELYESVGESLSALVARDAATAEGALDHAAQGIWGWGSVVLRTLGSIPTESQARARPFVLHALETGAGYHLAAAVISGTKLRMPELAPMLPDLASGDHEVQVRIAAIRALPILRTRDPATIDALIALLEDRAVAKEAHRALLRQSGVRLPLRAEAWRAWRTKHLAEESAAEAAAAPVAPVVAAPAVVAPVDERSLSWWPVAALVALLAGAAGAARAFGASAATAPAPDAPAAPAPSRLSLATSTRLERLGSDLDERSAAGEGVAESGAVVLSLREALRPVVEESSLSPASLAAVRELVRLGHGVGDPMDTAAFDHLQGAVAQVEGTLPGGGGSLVEVGRECCFVLLQIAFLRRADRPVAPELEARLVELLADLDRRLPASAPVAAPEATLDVAVAFPELSPANEQAVERTLDVATAFAEPAPAPPVERTLDVATAFAEPAPAPPVDAPTLDVAAAFGDAPRPADAGTIDVAEAFPEPRAD
jgi:hypothetical protein